MALGAIGLCAAVGAASAAGPTRVRVASYEFGVVFYYDAGQPAGLVPKLVSVLNNMQDDYVFEFTETSSRRRYADLTSGDVDILLLESAAWEWEGHDVLFSDPIVRERDVYIARKDDPDADRLFDDVTAYPILCVLGFHYGFADFHSSPDYLRQNFDVLLRYNEKDVLHGLLAGKGRLAIVSTGFLAQELDRHPGLPDRIRVGKTPDSIYDLVSVIAKDAAITLADFNALVARLKETGEIEHYWRQLHGDVSG